MHVGRNSGTRFPTKVHPDIETMGIEGVPQNTHAKGYQFEQLGTLLLDQVDKIGNLPHRADKQMPGIVGIPIQNDEGACPSIE